MMSYDPLPPTDGINLYKGSGSGGGAEIDDDNPLRVFFRLFMPNFNPAEQNRNEGDQP